MRRMRYQFGAVQQKERKRGPNVWVFRFRDEHGVKRSVEIGTVEKLPRRADAQRAAESLRLAANSDAPAIHGLTFAGLIDRYIADEMPKRYSTAKAYQAYLRTHIKPKWGDYQLSQIKPFGVEQWLKGLDLAPKSKGHIRTIMLNIFNCAMRWEFIPIGKNPLSLVRVPDISKRQTKAEVLTSAQVTKLIGAIEREPFRTMAWLAVCLGLEPSVLAGLKWGDFDFAKLQVKIQRGVVENRVDRAKNEYREAALPIDQQLTEMLLHWQKQTKWNGPQDWVFASPYFAGQKPYSPLHVADSISGRLLRRLAWAKSLAGVPFAVPIQACCANWESM